LGEEVRNDGVGKRDGEQKWGADGRDFEIQKLNARVDDSGIRV
jgi:hypothetical protein